MKTFRNITSIVAILIVCPFVTAAELPTLQGVSPGAMDRIAALDGACPTFSWTGIEGAAGYEIVAYVLPESPDTEYTLDSSSEVLSNQIPGGATGWTPSAEQCFAPGSRYVWFVRAVVENEAGESSIMTEWSDGLYFSVPSRPSVEQVTEALEVLHRYVAEGGDASVLAGTPSSPAHPSPRTITNPGSSTHAKSIETARAAIRGEHPDLTGETYGVVGTSSSPDGAGIGAANLDGGADLMLDGSVDGETDTLVWEWGLDRPSSSNERFSIRNSGAGSISLNVEGSLTATGLTCPDCVGSAEIADGSVGTADLDHFAVTTTKIAPDSINSGKIVNGQITTDDLATNAVTSDKIGTGQIGVDEVANGAVTKLKLSAAGGSSGQVLGTNGTGLVWQDAGVGAGDITAVTAGTGLSGGGTSGDVSLFIGHGAVGASMLADDAVTTDTIANHAVVTTKLATSSVTAVKIADGTITAPKIASGAVTNSKIASSAVSSLKIASSAVTTSKIADGTITGLKITSGAVTTSKIADGAVTNSKIASSAVTTSKIADGTITPTDVDQSKGFYVSKTRIYRRLASVVISGDNSDFASVTCDDDNDLPLSGGCWVDQPIGADQYRIMEFGPYNWTNNGMQSGWDCKWKSNSGPAMSYYAGIYCLSVD